MDTFFHIYFSHRELFRSTSKDIKWDVKHLGGPVRAVCALSLLAAPELLEVGGFCQGPRSHL